MTILLILGAVASFYMLWLLFRLASLALPFYAAIGTGFLLLRHEYSYMAAILAAFVAGIATLLIGQCIIAFTRSPLLRTTVALLFALPAGAAGYQAAHCLGSLATSDSTLLTVLGSIAAMSTSISAWRSVAAERAQYRREPTETPTMGSDFREAGSIVTNC
jgi:hypothetical protein